MRRFSFSLARELGMTVRQLLASIDSSELSEWVAYFKIEKARANEKGKPSATDITDKLKLAFGGLNRGNSRTTDGGNRGKRRSITKRHDPGI